MLCADRKDGTFQNRAKVVDSFCGDGSCLAGGFLKTVNWNLKGAKLPIRRVEHVGSGQTTHFQSLEDLLAFIARVLAQQKKRRQA